VNKQHSFIQGKEIPVEELISHKAKELRFPFAITSMRESINTAMYNKLETVYGRMVAAKQAYEEAGGRYEGWK
jgi:hypothetical protein